jgi:hypothetical protein
MDSQHRSVVVLSRALDQAGDALMAVHADDWDRPTPCQDWTVRELADHLAPRHDEDGVATVLADLFGLSSGLAR